MVAYYLVHGDLSLLNTEVFIMKGIFEKLRFL